MKFVLDKESVSSYIYENNNNAIKNCVRYYTANRSHSIDVSYGSWNEISICSQYYINNDIKYYSHEEVLKAFCKYFSIAIPKAMKVKPQRGGPWVFYEGVVFPWERHSKYFNRIIESNRIDDLEFYTLHEVSTKDLKKVIARRAKNKMELG